ncbi:MAG TPA: hypothetical protein VGD65_07540 [Chryseosolibacter sp.]
MRLFLSIVAVSFFGQAYSQDKDIDNFVRKVENLRREAKLTVKVYPDKAFEGSVTGYYVKDSLVLIATLTDAETGGRETLYYIREGQLRKVYIMTAKFDSNNEWAEYHTKHKSMDNCHSCHLKPNCMLTVVTFAADTTVEGTRLGQARTVTEKERASILSYTTKKSQELKTLLKEL